MAKDRLSEIREGAGLEESRLNAEFIEFVRKWSTPVIGVIAVVALIYVIDARLTRSRLARLDSAFVQLEQVNVQPGAVRTTEGYRLQTADPASLVRVAEEYKGARAVPILARLAAADAHMREVRLGLRAGSILTSEGKVALPDDLLTDEERERALQDAAALYSQVARDAESKPGHAIHRVSALFGIAAVEECRGELERARSAYERASNAAQVAGYGALARLAKDRIEGLSRIAAAPALFAGADLPELPWLKPPPAVPPVTPFDPDALNVGGPGDTTPPPESDAGSAESGESGGESGDDSGGGESGGDTGGGGTDDGGR